MSINSETNLECLEDSCLISILAKLIPKHLVRLIRSNKSPLPIFSPKIVTFEDDENAYNQADATGFIKINSLRLKQIAKRKRRTNQ